MAESRISFKVPGGLGNQLFSYFCALYTANSTNEIVRLDFSSVDRTHHVDSIPLLAIHMDDRFVKINQSTVRRSRLHPVLDSGKRIISSRIQNNQIHVFHPGQDSKNDMDRFLRHKLNNLGSKVIIDGYFGDFRFYDSLGSDLRKIKFRETSSNYVRIHNQTLESDFTAVHHRLGDFLNLSESVGVLDKNYYLEAFEYSLSRGCKSFLIFSNEPDKSRQIFDSWGFDLRLMNWISTSDLPHPFENLMLMGEAKAIICSNSTFSFWAAKLAMNRCKAIYFPREFRKDGLTKVENLPSSWIPIDSSWMLIADPK